MSTPACIAVAGFDSEWGPALCQRLLASALGLRIVGLDRLPEAEDFEKVESLPIDWSETDSDRKLAEILTKKSVDVLVHLGTSDFPTRAEETNPGFELERVRTLLRAADQAAVRRLVVASSTLLYGAQPDNPNFLTESHPLRGHPQATWLETRIQAEEHIREFAHNHPQTDVTVLRSCWTLGPRSRHPIARFFSQDAVPTCLGYDPLLQFIHEEDLLSVYERAIGDSHPGTFNIVGRGVLPLSTLLALAGKNRRPLPRILLERWPGSWPWGAETASSSAFHDYLRYLWVAAGERGWSEFGEPGYTSREAWISFVSAQRMSGYRG
ncbi:MAG: NAD-dependent epimerase/dehydratase family protein [Myxococcota bacterium]|nr:NAD-dependent epimerase/dehydratase family protein [Myxococcota bacterium]